MKNIHILPTDKPSSLYILGNNELKLRYTIDLPIDPDIAVNLHIYITSDEEIKVGDFVYSKRGFIGKFGEFENSYFDECKKIILTTDQSLIQDGVQAIDDEFLEWFVKNPSCEEVGVKLKQHFQADKLKRENLLNGVYHSYKIIIPKEEPKQETLEEAAKKYAGKYALSTRHISHIGFEDGAKWQAEKMYSEEEVDKLISIIEWYDNESDVRPDVEIFMWFEQFKKK